MNIFNKYPFLIAEIGVNFYDIAREEEMSDMEAAKLMIDEAKKCGVDAVKFQSYKAETIASKNSLHIGIYPRSLQLHNLNCSKI